MENPLTGVLAIAGIIVAIVPPLPVSGDMLPTLIVRELVIHGTNTILDTKPAAGRRRRLQHAEP